MTYPCKFVENCNGFARGYLLVIDMIQLRLNRTSLVSISLALSLLLSGQALACLSPSMQEMREGRAMACCAEHCRFETNDQAAKQACEQTRQALTQHEVLSNPSAALVLETAKSLPDSGSPQPVDFNATYLIRPSAQIKKHDLSKKFTSIEIYAFVRSFLI